MRCPKCGYNSFDHLDSCKKCGKDLVEHKQKFGIVSVLFPGQMKPVASAAATEDGSIVDDAVAVATAATAGTAAVAATAGAEQFSAAETASVETSDGDDFGFDFMGDSEEDDDLSFDELFEEASADEDVEETLPSPEAAAENADDDFAFDMTEEAGDAESSELEDDFGFDPAEVADEAVDDLETDEFSFDDDDELGEEESAGSKEDPKNPFDLPESSQHEEAPEETFKLFASEADPAAVASEEDGPLLSPSAEIIDTPLEVASEDSLVDSFFADDFSAAAEVPVSLDEVAAPPAGETPASVGSVVSPSGTDEFLPADVAPVPTESNPSSEISSNAPLTTAAVAGAGAAAAVAAGREERPAEQGGELLPATGNRIVAFCCDLLLLGLVAISFVIAAEAAISTSNAGLLPSMETLLDLSIPYFLVLFSLAFGYFTLFHFLAGQTPGKMLAGLRVETLDGEPLLFSQAFLRSVGGLLQALPIGLGYLVILSNPDRRGWNDQLAGTRLVSLKGLSEEV